MARNPLEMLRERYGAAVSSPSTLALEGAVDADEYLVGPGDVFAILIRGFETIGGAVPVSADGRLAIPDAGSVAVADLTLAEARAAVSQALRPSFGDTPVDLTLVQPRSFFVHVTGAVATPGRFQAMPGSRISTVLEIAYADMNRAPVANLGLRPSLRNVTVVSRDGSEVRLDLPRYFSGGAKDQNPYLKDGDVVIVAAYDPDFESVRIDGSVPFPGAYDARPDDTVRDLLAVAGMTRMPAFDAVVRITRAQPDGSVTTDSFSLDEAIGGTRADTPIQARDHVSVEPAFLPGGVASVDGWVFYPGTYPIQEGKTTVRELLERAGGLRKGALTSGAYVVRPHPSQNDIALPTNRFDRVPDLAALATPDTLAFLQKMRLTDMSFISRMHFALEYRYQNRVSIDLEAMLEGRAEPVVLRDGDRLVIPRDDQSVYVFGQVRQPGFVAFEPGQTATHYIEAAGELGPNAGQIVVLRGQNGDLVDDERATVFSGDLIFIDRKKDVAETLQTMEAAIIAEEARREARFRAIQAVLTGMSTLGTLIALIVSLRRN